MKKDKQLLSHLNIEGNPQMVDVSEKISTVRTATAATRVNFPPEIFEELLKNNFLSKKGSIIHTAIIAGTMGAKRTAELIPLCHPLQLSSINIDIEKGINLLTITAVVKCEGKTGVEMEALMAVSISALTVYDMCKALSHHIIISETKLIAKKGGKNDF